MSKKFTEMRERANQAVRSSPQKVIASGDDRRTVEIPLENLSPASWNARKFYDAEALMKLAADLKKNGQIQTVVVRPKKDGTNQVYEVIVGNRRLHAAKEAGLKTLRAEIRYLDDIAAQYLSFAENLQRVDLNPFEETLGYLGMLNLLLKETTAFKAFKEPEESDEHAVGRLLRRYANEKQRLENNVILKPNHESAGSNKAQVQVLGTTLEQTIQTVFATVEHMTWQSFVKNRLPLIKMPSDVICAVQEGKLEYTKARKIGRVKDDSIRKHLLETTQREALSLDEVSAHVQRATENAKVTLPSAQKDLFKRGKAIAEALKKSRELEHKTKLKKAARLLGELESLLGIEGGEASTSH